MNIRETCLQITVLSHRRLIEVYSIPGSFAATHTRACGIRSINKIQFGSASLKRESNTLDITQLSVPTSDSVCSGVSLNEKVGAKQKW